MAQGNGGHRQSLVGQGPYRLARPNLSYKQGTQGTLRCPPACPRSQARSAARPPGPTTALGGHTPWPSNPFSFLAHSQVSVPGQVAMMMTMTARDYNPVALYKNAGVHAGRKAPTHRPLRGRGATQGGECQLLNMEGQKSRITTATRE